MEHKMQELSHLGFENIGNVYWNLPTTALYEQAIRRREGLLSHLGPLVVRTGQYTGRSPKDKFLVEDVENQGKIWWGDVNQPFTVEEYNRLRNRILAYLQGRDLYVQDLYACADEDYRLSLRVITESAWHALFARNMFIIEKYWDKLEDFKSDYTMIHVPHFRAIPELDSTRSDVFVILNFERKEILIGGSSYAGEMKKAIFTVLNYLLPLQGVLSMHCSANQGKDPQDVALFFGLSGTGKTTLSIESSRTLIGDDEHGWSPKGIFNFEGGCYAKLIRISSKTEPEIYETTRRFGTIIENVAIDLKTRRIDLDDDTLTENTRGAFPISHLPNASITGTAAHPNVIFFLTADAFGVLPPISRLTPTQAIYYFLLGYTAKVAGTERGVKEPSATFSTCFGAPFMVHSPVVYAEMLGEKIRENDVQVWLVNTGWTGGSYGIGHRIDLPYTRAMIRAVLEGKLSGVNFETDPVFRLSIPTTVPEVPDEILKPKGTWKDGKLYDAKSRELTEKFHQAFKEFENTVDEDVRNSGPSRGT
jgi:phosphoenolpyruvate carboxykinase (ATP)